MTTIEIDGRVVENWVRLDTETDFGTLWSAKIYSRYDGEVYKWLDSLRDKLSVIEIITEKEAIAFEARLRVLSIATGSDGNTLIISTFVESI